MKKDVIRQIGDITPNQNDGAETGDIYETGDAFPRVIGAYSEYGDADDDDYDDYEDDDDGDIYGDIFDEMSGDIVDADYDFGDILEETGMLDDEYEETGGLFKRKRGRGKKRGKGLRNLLKRGGIGGALIKKLGAKITGNRRRAAVTASAGKSAVKASQAAMAGKKMGGAILPIDGLPFIHVENGIIEQVLTIKAGSKTNGYRFNYLLTDILQATPWNSSITSGVLAAGAGSTFSAKDGLASSEVEYRTPFALVSIGSSALGANPSKVFTITLQTYIDSVYTDVYAVRVRYADSSKALVATLVNGLQVNGEWYPRNEVIVNSATPGLNRGLAVKVQGGDGVNDTSTIIFPGSEHPFVKGLTEKIMLGMS